MLACPATNPPLKTQSVAKEQASQQGVQKGNGSGTRRVCYVHACLYAFVHRHWNGAVLINVLMDCIFVPIAALLVAA